MGRDILQRKRKRTANNLVLPTKEKYLPAGVRKSYQVQTSRQDLISHITSFAFLVIVSFFFFKVMFLCLFLSHNQNILKSPQTYFW
jgi:hypothetical protein